MKTNLRSYMVLALGLFAFSFATGQKTVSEYDDIYYIPSSKKAVKTEAVQEPVTLETPTALKASRKLPDRKPLPTLLNMHRIRNMFHRNTSKKTVIPILPIIITTPMIITMPPVSGGFTILFIH